MTVENLLDLRFALTRKALASSLCSARVLQKALSGTLAQCFIFEVSDA